MKEHLRHVEAWVGALAVIVGRVARVPRLVRTTLGMVLTRVLTGCLVLAGQRLLSSAPPRLAEG